MYQVFNCAVVQFHQDQIIESVGDLNPPAVGTAKAGQAIQRIARHIRWTGAGTPALILKELREVSPKIVDT